MRARWLIVAAIASLLACKERRETGEIVVAVITTYPGAAAATVESDVSKTIEEALAGEEGLVLLESESNEGRSVVTATFHGPIQRLEALTAVTERLKAAQKNLPVEADVPITLVPREVSFTVVLQPLDPMSPMDLRASADALAEALERTRGVASADVVGVEPRAINVWLDPDRAASMGVATSDIVSALRGSGLGASSAEDLASVVLPVPSSTAVRLSDIATIEDGVGPRRSVASRGGTPVAAVDVSLVDWRLTKDVLAEADASWTSARLGNGGVFPYEKSREVRLRPLAGASLEEAARVAGELSVPGTTALITDARTGGAVVRVLSYTGADRDAIRARLRSGTKGLALLPSPEKGEVLDLAISGPDLDVLSDRSARLAAALAKSDDVVAIDVRPPAPAPELRVEVDRGRAAVFGIAIADAAQVLGVPVNGADMGRARGVPVTLRLRHDGMPDPGKLFEGLSVRARTGQAVPVRDFVSARIEVAPPVILRRNRQRVALISVQSDHPERVASLAARALEEDPLPSGFTFSAVRPYSPPPAWAFAATVLCTMAAFACVASAAGAIVFFARRAKTSRS